MSRLPVAVATVLLLLSLSACTGADQPGAASRTGEPTGSPDADASSAPETVAQRLTDQLFESDERGEPLATVTGTFQSSTGGTSPVEVDVLEVRAAEQSTLLRWRLRSASDERVDVTSSALSLPSRFDTRGIALVDSTGNQRLQPFTYVPQSSEVDLRCVCSELPSRVGSEGVLMYSLYPPLAAGASSVDVLVPGLTVAQDVEVAR